MGIKGDKINHWRNYYPIVTDDNSQSIWGKRLKSLFDMYNWVTLLYTWNYHMLINYYSNINFFQSLSLIKLRYQKSEKLPLEGLDSEFFEVEQKMSGVTQHFWVESKSQSEPRGQMGVIDTVAVSHWGCWNHYNWAWLNEGGKSLGAIPLFSILYSTSLPGPKSKKKEILENLIPHAVKNE